MTGARRGDPLQASSSSSRTSKARHRAERKEASRSKSNSARTSSTARRRASTDTLDAALAKYPPLDIINDHLLDGMKTVGELFGSGQMQLPFVLQSAEVMKMAVSHLEPHMEKIGQGQTKGSIVLATVKGDVHDIGKNLVDIILTNNGYRSSTSASSSPADIIKAWQEHKADAIGSPACSSSPST
jgi:5-methyltetrahydrofolate--homocysteine methyltransferase